MDNVRIHADGAKVDWLRKNREGEILGRARAWYFVSFSGDDGFRGGAFVEAFGPSDAHLQVIERGLSPGGHALIVRAPDQAPPPPENLRYRLASIADLDEVWPHVEVRVITEEAD